MQALLPIVENPRPTPRLEPDADAVRQPPGVQYFDLPTRSILNRPKGPMPFQWSINPYRGCELGCTYCFARYTHGFFNLGRWQDFEKKIFVKQDAAASLEARLRQVSLHGEPIAIGTATDPYQSAERHFGITRSLLEAFLKVEGLELSLTTKSPLILRDLELLTELDRRHSVTLNISLTCADTALSQRLEPHAPSPAARLRAVEKLSRNGLFTQVYVMPILPGINEGGRVLRPLLEACRDAGAADVKASPLFLKPATRDRFLPWLTQEFPDLKKRYERLYGRRDVLSRVEADRLLGPFFLLRLEHGFPQPLPGRG